MKTMILGAPRHSAYSASSFSIQDISLGSALKHEVGWLGVFASRGALTPVRTNHVTSKPLSTNPLLKGDSPSAGHRF